MSTLRANTPTWLWDTVALKHVVLSIQTGPFGSQLHAEDYSSGGRPVINPAHLRDGQIEPDSDSAVDDDTFGRLSQHELREGDVVIGCRGELGRCGVVTRDQAGWLCGTGSIRVRPDTCKLHSSWLRWLLAWTGSREWLTLESVGSTMDNLGAETVGSMPIPVPPLRFQRLIADYLDRETVRLDGLVAAKERVLGLVAEKRRALITRAVTRGLDPRTPLRDSGIPWLGEIPAHWELKRAKWLFRERDERSTTGEEVLLSLRMERGLVPHDEVSEKQTRAEELIGYKKTSLNEIVINRMRAASGLVAVSPHDGLVSPDYAVFQTAPSVDPQYFTHLFKTELLQAVFRSESTGLGTGSSGFLRLYSDSFLSLWLPCPPHREQCAILQYIADETSKLDALRSATERTIALLKERRAALITAAVTGRMTIHESTEENLSGTDRCQDN